MDDVTALGPLWISQLTKEVAHRRNRATESLLTIDPDGDFAKQHLMFIKAANTMLAAPQLVAALREAIEIIQAIDQADNTCEKRIDVSSFRAALAAAEA